MSSEIAIERQKNPRLLALRARFSKNHVVFLALKVLWIVSLFLVLPDKVKAEGSWQMGLFEGLTHRQAMYETNVALGYNLLNVDILTPGEVINVHACGTADTNNIRVRIFDPNGTGVYDNTAAGNVPCGSDFDTTFDPAVSNPHQYVATTTGAHAVWLTNNNGTFLLRYDVTVTNSVNDIIDPRINGGRLWSLYWNFNAGSYAEEFATDADLYVVADGGFVNSFFIWRLDLTNFAGFVYSLRANSLGVTSPNAAGDVVAGISVPTGNNAVQEQFPIYLGYPALNYPAPIGGVDVSGLSFVDSDGEDSGISPGTTNGVQDSGVFSFSTNLTTTGVYEIIIDNSSPTGGGPDGLYGQGDIFLRGTALPGLNTVVWNGEDNNGVTVPENAYTATLSVRTGEFHFAAQDVETSGGAGSDGIKIYRAQANGADLPTTLFWDDLTVLNSTSPNAFNQDGIFDGNHNWGAFNAGGIGNNSFIDTYTFGLVIEPDAVGVAVTENDIPMPTVSKSFIPGAINTNAVTTMQLEIDYNGIIDLTGVALTDTMPNGMTLVSNPGSITVTGAGCSGFSFSADTVAGGDVLNIIDGNIDSSSTCVISAEVTASLPGDLVNTTSGISSNELATGVVSNGATLNVQPNPAGAGYACDGSFYESETTGLSSRLYQVNRSAVPFTRQEFSSASYAPTSGYSYTGLAYNPTDNYLYAIVNQTDGSAGTPLSGSILRIDASGQIYNLGVPERGPNTMQMPVVSDRYVGGTIGEDGRYIVVTDLSATSNTGTAIPLVERGLIIDIDLTGPVPQVIYNRRHGRDVGDIVAHPDGLLYSHNTVEGLITIDNISGAVNIVGGNVTDVVSGLMADAWGTLFAQTVSGNLLGIDAATGNSTSITALAAAATADGASCPFGLALRKTASAAQVTPGESVVYSMSVVNESNSVSTFTLNDVLGDARTFEPGSLVNPLGGSSNVYGDTSALTISGATIGANSTAVVQIEVNYPHDYLPGDASNQASIVEVSLGTVLSDDPDTADYPDGIAIEVLPGPALGISKHATVNGNDITYEFVLENFGNTPLSNISLSDDLDAVFGVGNYALVVPPAFGANPGTLTIDTSFTGAGSNPVLLNAADAGSLAVGANALLRFTVRVTSLIDMGSGTGVYSNQVELFGEDPDSNVLSDLSVEGSDPDPDDNHVPDEESLTVSILIQTILIEGVVFEDNGSGGAAAHDGSHGGTESLLAGVIVEARDGATLIASATTTADGQYTLNVPASYGNMIIQVVTGVTSGYLSVSEFFREDPGNTGPVADGSVSLTPQLSFVGAYKIDFGRVRVPSWTSDSIAEQSPAATVYHSHRYHPRTSGQLSFSLTGLSSLPSNDAWQVTLHRDLNCNTVLDTGEPALPSNFPVSEDAEPIICVLAKVFVPADASGGDSFRYSITATLALDDPLATGHAVSSVLEVTDVTMVIASGEGVLVLSKTVQNISNGGAAVTANNALPGQVLRYSIDFTNSGSGPVTELLISDSTPAFTTLSTPVNCPVTLPAGLSACQIVVPTGAANQAGYSGQVQWEFAGTLAAGAAGEVLYDIIVD